MKKTLENRAKQKKDIQIYTGKDEQISAMAIPTNQVKNVVTSQPHSMVAGPAYLRLCPYRGVPVNTDMHENVMANVLNKVCTK